MIETLSINQADNQESVLVGLGELKVTRSPSVILACLGIGSCIAVCVYDHLYKVGGMAHVVLPHCEGKPGDNPGKYADTSIPMLIGEVVKQTNALFVVDVISGLGADKFSRLNYS